VHKKFRSFSAACKFCCPIRSQSVHAILQSLLCIYVFSCANSVYWCDVHSVQSVSVDGSARIIHVMSPTYSFVAISLHLVITFSYFHMITIALSRHLATEESGGHLLPKFVRCPVQKNPLPSQKNVTVYVSGLVFNCTPAVSYVDTKYFDTVTSKPLMQMFIWTQDVMVCIKFGDDRISGFWLAGCQSSPFPIDFAGRPYNSATLPRAL